MQKRKFKINILDIVIVIAVICSIAALSFRDTISEIFTKPETATMEMSFVVADDSEEHLEHIITNSQIALKLNPNSDETIKVTLKSLKHDESGNGVVVVTCMGYKRLGRFYSENDVKIELNTEYALTAGDAQVKGSFKTIEIK